jgi:hypothetical protein
VFESGGRGDRRDRQGVHLVLEALDVHGQMIYEHLRPFEEPLLWIPDAIAWAWGAGGDWRRRISIDAAVRTCP